MKCFNNNLTKTKTRREAKTLNNKREESASDTERMDTESSQGSGRNTPTNKKEERRRDYISSEPAVEITAEVCSKVETKETESISAENISAEMKMEAASTPLPPDTDLQTVEVTRVEEETERKCKSVRRKRRIMHLSSSETEEEGEVVEIEDVEKAVKMKKKKKKMAKGSIVINKRPRGRPPKEGCGLYIGYRKAQEDLAHQKREEEYLQAERELEEEWTEMANTRAMKALKGETIEEGKEEEEKREIPDLPVTEIIVEVNKSVQAIRQISSFTKGYKGTSRKVLKEVADVISSATKELSRRTANEENIKLMEENRQLKAEIMSMKRIVQGFREEIKNLREEFATSGKKGEIPAKKKEASSINLQLGRVNRDTNVIQKSPQQDADKSMAELQASIIKQVGEMMKARFAVVEERLPPEKSLRPPLGNTAKKTAPAGVKPLKTYAAVTAAKIGESSKDKGSQKTKTKPLQTSAPLKSGQKEGEMTVRKPKVVSIEKVSTDIRVLPAPQDIRKEEQEWTVAEAKKKNRKKKEMKNIGNPQPVKKEVKTTVVAAAEKREVAAKNGKKAAAKETNRSDKKEVNKPKVNPRPHKRAAVLISMPSQREDEMETTDGEGVAIQRSLGETMAGIQKDICLKDFGISALKPKRAATGGLLYEVPGEGNAEKAKLLAEALKKSLEPKGIKVTVPTKRTEMRISGLEDSATTDAIKASLAETGSCLVEEVKTGRITRSPRDGLGTCWVQVPTTAASKIIKSGPLIIGWATVRVEALEARPLQCFRCMGVGHTRATCKAETDRSGLCYRCGKTGHKAAECTDKPCCPYCKDFGLKADHRYGGRACNYAKTGKKGGNNGKQEPDRKGKREKGEKIPNKPAQEGAAKEDSREEASKA